MYIYIYIYIYIYSPVSDADIEESCFSFYEHIFVKTKK